MKYNFLGNFQEKLGRQLAKAGIPGKPDAYMGKGIKLSVLASVVFWFLWSLFNSDIYSGILATALVFIVCISAVFLYPGMMARKRAAMIEKELPFMMLNLSLHTRARQPMENAIAKIASGGNDLLSLELRKALAEVKGKGTSLNDALLSFCGRFDSRSLKRSIMQIISCHDLGNRKLGSLAMKRLGREELARQRSVGREFSGKIALLSLMFIAVSAIVPALFQSFIIVGSTFMRFDFTPVQIFVAIAFVLPAVDIALLLYIRAITPEFLK